MNRAIAHGSQNWRLCLKKHFLSLSVTAVALLAVCSVLIHPSGAMKAQRSDKPLLLDASFDPQVVRIIERSCQNCHSERTEWPLYSYVVPMSWMIENDVKRGTESYEFFSLERIPA